MSKLSTIQEVPENEYTDITITPSYLSNTNGENTFIPAVLTYTYGEKEKKLNAGQCIEYTRINKRKGQITVREKITRFNEKPGNDKYKSKLFYSNDPDYDEDNTKNIDDIDEVERKINKLEPYTIVECERPDKETKGGKRKKYKKSKKKSKKGGKIKKKTIRRL